MKKIASLIMEVGWSHSLSSAAGKRQLIKIKELRYNVREKNL